MIFYDFYNFYECFMIFLWFFYDFFMIFMIFLWFFYDFFGCTCACTQAPKKHRGPPKTSRLLTPVGEGQVPACRHLQIYCRLQQKYLSLIRPICSALQVLNQRPKFPRSGQQFQNLHFRSICTSAAVVHVSFLTAGSRTFFFF